ncbi:hypothetical protein ACOSP7_002737 [Xanthoceras sorbifolium]
MNRFQLCCLLIVAAAASLLLFYTPRIHAARSSFPSPSTRNHRHLQHQQEQQQEAAFHPSVTAPSFSSTTREFESQKRRIPTGSNPLHNKRR